MDIIKLEKYLIWEAGVDGKLIIRKILLKVISKQNPQERVLDQDIRLVTIEEL